MPPPLGVELQHHVARGGDVARTVIVAAERLGVDAVCLARNSHGPLGRVLLSSVATQVARDCRVPVLLVQPTRS